MKILIILLIILILKITYQNYYCKDNPEFDKFPSDSMDNACRIYHQIKKSSKSCPSSAMFNYLKTIKNINFDNETNDEIKFVQKIYRSNTDCMYYNKYVNPYYYVSSGFYYGFRKDGGCNYMIFDKNTNVYIPSRNDDDYGYDLFELDDEDTKILADYMYKGLIEIKEINNVRYYIIDNVAKKISKWYKKEDNVYISNNNKFIILTVPNNAFVNREYIQIFMSFIENNMEIFTDKLYNQNMKFLMNIHETQIQKNNNNYQNIKNLTNNNEMQIQKIDNDNQNIKNFINNHELQIQKINIDNKNIKNLTNNNDVQIQNIKNLTNINEIQIQKIYDNVQNIKNSIDNIETQIQKINVDNQNLKNSINNNEIQIQKIDSDNREKYIKINEIITNNSDEYNKNNKIIYGDLKELNKRYELIIIENRILYCYIIISHIIIFVVIILCMIVCIILIIICILKTKKKKMNNNRIDEMDDIKADLIIDDEKFDDAKIENDKKNDETQK
jgi:hypothetical protein